MTQKYLNILLLALIILGLISFFLYTFLYSPKEIFLLEDNYDNLEKVVLVKGSIKNIELKENNLFFKVCNYSKCIDAVYFNISSNKYITIENIKKNNNYISVTGKLTLYNNKLEIIVYNFSEEKNAS